MAKPQWFPRSRCRVLIARRCFEPRGRFWAVGSGQESWLQGSPRHAGLGLADLSLGPGEYGWVARANDPQWEMFPLLQELGLCLSGTKGARWVWHVSSPQDDWLMGHTGVGPHVSEWVSCPFPSLLFSLFTIWKRNCHTLSRKPNQTSNWCPANSFNFLNNCHIKCSDVNLNV